MQIPIIRAIVWATEVDLADDARLLDYFRDRRVWVVYSDADQRDPSRVLPKITISEDKPGL